MYTVPLVAALAQWPLYTVRLFINDIVCGELHGTHSHVTRVLYIIYRIYIVCVYINYNNIVKYGDIYHLYE